MKKNLLYLLALVCSLTFFAACSSDDDDSDNKNNGNPPEEEAAITAPDVVGTYWGNLDISMIPDGSDQEIVIGDGIEKFITLSQVSNTEVKIELKEFELFINQQILKFGDIVVDKCEVKKGQTPYSSKRQRKGERRNRKIENKYPVENLIDFVMIQNRTKMNDNSFSITNSH